VQREGEAGVKGSVLARLEGREEEPVKVTGAVLEWKGNLS